MILLLCVSLCLVSCGAIKAYEGPELPRAQLAVLRVNFTGGEGCRPNGVKIGLHNLSSRDTFFLPGKYKLVSEIIAFSEPYDCLTSTFIDEVAYSNCTREKEKSRGEFTRGRNCAGEARRTRTVCSIDYSYFSCEGEISLLAGETWELHGQISDRNENGDPSDANLVLKPTKEAISEIELTKIQYLQKLILPDPQSVSNCRFLKKWTTRQ